MTQASNLGKGGSNFNSSGQLNLTTGVTETLPVANGGTGSTSFTATQWTTSSSNIYYTTGNVGIGTSSPATKFQVAGSSGSLNARISAGNTGLDITNNDATGVTNIATSPLGGGGKALSFSGYNGTSAFEAMRLILLAHYC